MLYFSDKYFPMQATKHFTNFSNDSIALSEIMYLYCHNRMKYKIHITMLLIAPVLSFTASGGSCKAVSFPDNRRSSLGSGFSSQISGSPSEQVSISASDEESLLVSVAHPTPKSSESDMGEPSDICSFVDSASKSFSNIFAACKKREHGVIQSTKLVALLFGS